MAEGVIQTVRDRKLSLWQSAVSEALLTKLKDTLPAEDAARKLQAASAHAVADYSKTPIASPENRSQDPSGLLAQTWLSKTHFDLANAQLEGDAAKADGLATDIRKYSTLDLSGWATCLTTYTEYYAKYKTATYHDWTEEGGHDWNYSVIDWQLPNDAKVLMLGDWGTGLSDAVSMVEQALTEYQIDAIIHLGDIYYSGTPSECQAHFVDALHGLFEKLGLESIPVFAIPGNHEYYAAGRGFYDKILPLINEGRSDCLQPASYFCLRTADGAWQFLGMDTGIHDNNPYTEFAPTGTGPRLVPSEAEWHLEKIDQFSGKTILLSHHQLYSANNNINGSASGLPEYMNEGLLETFRSKFSTKISAWFWGHEHNYVLFKDGQFGLAKGRLVGASSYEQRESSDAYKINHPEVAYEDGMVELGGAQGYYNHCCAVLDFKRDSPDDPISISYFQFPSWAQNAVPPDPLPPLSLLNTESLSAPGEVTTYAWTGNQPIKDISTISPESDQAPALAAYQGKLYMIYRGALKDDYYVSVFDGQDWTGNQAIENLPGGISPESDSPPGLAVYYGVLQLAYRGTLTDNLYMSFFDGTYWTGNQKIEDMPGGIDPKSNYAPALAVFKDVLYLAYKGAHSDDLYLAWYDGSAWRGNEKISDMPGDIDPQSNRGPALAAYGDALWLVYKDSGSDDLCQAAYNGSQWSGGQKISSMAGGISPQSDQAPAIASFQDTLFLIYKGAHSNELYVADWTGSKWTGNTKISEVSAIDPKSDRSPAISPYDGALFLTYKGDWTDDLYEAQYAAI